MEVVLYPRSPSAKLYMHKVGDELLLLIVYYLVEESPLAGCDVCILPPVTDSVKMACVFRQISVYPET